jgi:hypothetical protein
VSETERERERGGGRGRERKLDAEKEMDIEEMMRETKQRQALRNTGTCPQIDR